MRADLLFHFCFKWHQYFIDFYGINYNSYYTQSRLKFKFISINRLHFFLLLLKSILYGRQTNVKWVLVLCVFFRSQTAFQKHYFTILVSNFYICFFSSLYTGEASRNPLKVHSRYLGLLFGKLNIFHILLQWVAI